MQVFQTSKVHPPNKAQEGPEKLSQIPTPPTCFAHPAPFRGHHHQEGDVSEQRIVPWIPPTSYSIPTLLHVHQHLNNCLAGYRATGLPIYFSKYHKYFNRLLYHKLNTRKHCYWLQFVNTFWLAAQNRSGRRVMLGCCVMLYTSELRGICCLAPPPEWHGSSAFDFHELKGDMLLCMFYTLLHINVMKHLNFTIKS